MPFVLPLCKTEAPSKAVIHTPCSFSKGREKGEGAAGEGKALQSYKLSFLGALRIPCYRRIGCMWPQQHPFPQGFCSSPCLQITECTKAAQSCHRREILCLSRMDSPVFSTLKVSYLAQALLGRSELCSSSVLSVIYHSPIFAESSMDVRR